MITILLPARNEEKAIASVINEVRQLPVACDIVVADSASSDRTPAIAEGMGATVIYAPQGKGLAIQAAIASLKEEYTFMLNSDLSYAPEHIPEMLNKLEAGYDVVVGERKYFEDGSTNEFNRFGNEALAALASLIFNVPIYDLCTGMWGFRTEALKAMDITSPGFTLEADLYINILKHNYRWTTVPIVYRRRAGISHFRPKDGIKIGWFLIKRRFSKC